MIKEKHSTDNYIVDSGNILRALYEKEMIERLGEIPEPDYNGVYAKQLKEKNSHKEASEREANKDNIEKRCDNRK
jgi:hypothetical protein